MTEEFVTLSTPVFTVDGVQQASLTRDAVHVSVEEDTAGLKTLQARFVALGPRAGSDDEQLLYVDGEIFDLGSSLELAIGPSGQARTVFYGNISAVELSFEEGQEPELQVFAEDKLMQLRMTRRSASYEQVTDAEVAQRIADEHGLNCHADAPGPTYANVQQWNMSDLAFLRERARLVQAEIWIDREDLYFMGRPQRPGETISLVVGNQLLSLSARADLAHQRTSVHVSGYDAQDRATIDESADVSAIEAEVSGGRTGPQVLQATLGSRTSQRVNEVPLNSETASEWAQAEMLRRARGFVQIEGTTSGTPNLTVGSQVQLERAGTPFNGGGYYVTRVCHTFDLASGYRTHFDAERPNIEVTS